MKIEEKLAMNSRLGTSTRRAPTPSLQVGRRHADDRREVAGDERQHARREERHEAGGQRQRDAHAGGGVGAGEQQLRVAHGCISEARSRDRGTQLGDLALEFRDALLQVGGGLAARSCACRLVPV